MYFTPIRLELLSRSRTNQIVAYKVESFLCPVWDSAIFVVFFFLHTVGFQSRISRMSSTAAWLRGKEKERNLAGAILRICQTSETINSSANCSDLSISLDPSGSGIWLFIAWKRQKIWVFRETDKFKTLKALKQTCKRERDRRKERKKKRKKKFFIVAWWIDLGSFASGARMLTTRPRFPMTSSTLNF